MLLSALTAEEVNPKYVLSTQLNFTPLIFSLTQKEDIDNVIIASSISNLSNKHKGYSELLGNNISYNWVNYSSMIAVEYLVSNNIDRFAPLKIVDNQVVYPVKLYQVKRGSFELIKF
jgi:SRSO17 transposase